VRLDVGDTPQSGLRVNTNNVAVRFHKPKKVGSRAVVLTVSDTTNIVDLILDPPVAADVPGQA
jgi:hypothetical protein